MTMNKSLLLLFPLVALADGAVTKQEVRPSNIFTRLGREWKEEGVPQKISVRPMDWETRTRQLKTIPRTYAEFRALYPIRSSDRKYPEGFTSKERVKIDKLSRQVRLYDRGMLMQPTCRSGHARAKARRDKAFEDLRKLEPTTDKYYKMKYARYNIREDWRGPLR